MRTFHLHYTTTASGINIPGSGTHQIAAAYSGSTQYSGSTSITVGLAATPIPTAVDITAPISVAAGSPFTVMVRVYPPVTDNFTPTGTVSLFNGGNLAGTATLVNSQAMFTLLAPAAGTDTLTASYSGSTNFAASTSN